MSQSFYTPATMMKLDSSPKTRKKTFILTDFNRKWWWLPRKVTIMIRNREDLSEATVRIDKWSVEQKYFYGCQLSELCFTEETLERPKKGIFRDPAVIDSIMFH